MNLWGGVSTGRGYVDDEIGKVFELEVLLEAVELAGLLKNIDEGEH